MTRSREAIWDAYLAGNQTDAQYQAALAESAEADRTEADD